MDFLNFDKDCENLDKCKQLGEVYAKCYKGTASLTDKRCSLETRKLIALQFSQIPTSKEKSTSNLERITLWLIAITALIVAFVK